MHHHAFLAELEIVVSRSAGRPEAVFDVTAAQATAVQDALVYYHRVRFGGQALDADMVSQLRALDGLSEQAHRRGNPTIPAVLRAGSADAAAIIVNANRDGQLDSGRFAFTSSCRRPGGQPVVNEAWSTVDIDDA